MWEWEGAKGKKVYFLILFVCLLLPKFVWKQPDSTHVVVFTRRLFRIYLFSNSPSTSANILLFAHRFKEHIYTQ